MEKFKKRLSLFMVFVFLVAFVPKFSFSARAADNQMPAADTSVTLVGSFASANNLGNDWAPDNAQLLMKEYSNGIYEIAVNFIKTGTYEYKAALNRGWDNAIGNAVDNNNKAINVTSTGTVIFRVDLKAGKVYDTINDPSQFKTSATLTGSFGTDGDTTFWNPANASYDLAYIGGGFYKKTFSLTKGDYDYKVAYNHAWSNGEVGANVKLHLDSDQDVTFLANPINGICTDSVSNPTILGNISLIGTIRGDDAINWTADAKGYEFSYLTGDGKYIYSAFFQTDGTFEYKGIENYSWDSGGLPASGNVSITIPDGGKYVVFVADRANKTMIDSINNPDEVAAALGLKQPEVTVQSPVINPNGTVTFNYKDDSAATVSLRGSMNDWGETPMVKDSKTGIWSYTYRPGDAAQNIEYKFYVDGSWITDPLNTQLSNGNSLLAFPEYTGRKVVLAGTIQTAAGETAWNPSSDITKFNYDGNGLYSISIKNVPSGNYEYKVAMGAWDPENYGANGVSYGSNMSVTVPATQDMTFWYSDDSHYTVNSIEYQKLDITLKGTGIPDGTKMADPLLSNLYSAKIKLSAGTYNDITAVTGGKEYSFGTITLSQDKEVTFTYVPAVQMVYSDAADKLISADQLYFDSRLTDYKTPYGAVPVDSTVTFNLKAKKDDLTVAKLVLLTGNGTQMIDMHKNGSFSDGSDKWTATYKFDQIEMDKYYFIVSNGADLKAYGDDDGYFGPGKASDIGNVLKYDLNVYKDNYKTPDWLKNAVIYQIFPDRFFNGDSSNDYNQKLSRGYLPYEYPEDWYSVPEDPTLEFKTDENGDVITNPDGTPKEAIPDYKGTPGDGKWGNEMYGGDLKGVEDKLNYLQSLGVTVLYLNPISESISNHRYDTTDYSKVDPLLGTISDFENLTNEAHKRGMHVILDGVFNHVSDDSIYFDRYGKYMAKGRPIGAYQYWSKVYDLMNLKGLNQQDAEKQVQADLAAMGITDFTYKDWFKIDNKKVNEGQSDEHYAYEGWWSNDSMPVITNPNGSEYNVTTWADQIIDGPDANSRFWLNEGSDGWRLDVANEVSDETWRHFREAVKAEGDDAIVGEIWDNASKYLLGDMYDSVMNYRFRDAVIGFVTGTDTSGKPVDAVTAMNKLEQIREQYPKEAFEAMMNLVDSHDTQRIISAIDGYQKSVKDIAAPPSANALQMIKLVPLMQMTYPGAPTIYYGDEAAMAGADDPDCRRGMIWGEGNKDIVDWYALLANIRNAYSVLRTGDVEPLSATSGDIMAYARSNDTDRALIVINRGSAVNDFSVNVQGTIADGTKLTDAVSGKVYTVTDGKVTVNVPEKLGLILVTGYSADKVKVNYDGLKDVYDPSYKVPDRATPKEVADNIDSLDRVQSVEGNEVKFTEPQLITNDVLELARTLGKTVVLERGEVTFKLSPESLLGIIPNVEGKFDITVGSQLQNQSKIEEILKNQSADMIKALRFDTTISGGVLGAAVGVSVQLDKAQAGKTLYVYCYNPEDGLQLISKGQADSLGVLSFSITHCSDYFITDKELSNTVPGDNESGNQNPGNGGSGSMPNTGSNIDAVLLADLGILAVLAGIIFLAADRKRRNKNNKA